MASKHGTEGAVGQTPVARIDRKLDDNEQRIWPLLRLDRSLLLEQSARRGRTRTAHHLMKSKIRQGSNEVYGDTRLEDSEIPKKPRRPLFLPRSI